MPTVDPPRTRFWRRRLPLRWRRRFVVGGGLTLVAGMVALAVVAIIEGDDTREHPSWEAVAGLDAATGRVVLWESDGDELDRLSTELAEITDVAVRGEHALVHHGRGDAAVAIVRMTTGEVIELTATTEFGAVDLDQVDVAWLPGTEAPIAAAFDPDGGNVIVIDGITGRTVDVGAEANLSSPLISDQEIIASPDGRTVAMTDRNSFQTVLIDLDADDPLFVPPGALAAMSHETVVTLQRTGGTGDLTFTSLDGERHAPAQVPAPLAVELIERGTVALITSDGRLLRASSGDRQPTELADLTEAVDEARESDDEPDDGDGQAAQATPDAGAGDDGNASSTPPAPPGWLTGEAAEDESGDEPSFAVTDFAVLSEAQRFLVATDDTVLILSTDGEVVAHYADHELWRIPGRDDRCLSVVDPNERVVRLLDARSGAERARAESGGGAHEPASSSDDGCVVDAAARTGTLLWRDEVVELDAELVAVSPDGTTVVTRPSRSAPLVVTSLVEDPSDPETMPLELDADLAVFVTTS